MKLTLSLAFLIATSMYAATANLSIASDPSQWSTLDSNLQINGLNQVDSLNWSHSIITAGPVRSGYLQIQTQGMGDSFSGATALLNTGFVGGPVSMIDPQYGTPATVALRALAEPPQPASALPVAATMDTST